MPKRPSTLPDDDDDAVTVQQFYSLANTNSSALTNIARGDDNSSERRTIPNMR